MSFTPSPEAPLIKKIGFFDSCLVGGERTRKGLRASAELAGASFHLELGVGLKDSAWCGLITEKEGALCYDFKELDEVLKAARKNGMELCLSYGYTPLPLQKTGDHTHMPCDLEAWKKMAAGMAAHFREHVPVEYHEVWNAPGNDDPVFKFFQGSWTDYLKLYQATAEGIREGDKEALVGGPSLVFSEMRTDHADRFLKFVRENKLPLDFLSVQSYGYHYKSLAGCFRETVENAGEEWKTLPIHLNQLNTIPAPWDYDRSCDHFLIASDMLKCFRELSDEQDVEVVNWAQLLESGVDALGLMNRKGFKKASYHAFRIWSRLPVDRAVYESAELPGMASYDKNRAAAVIWNDRTCDREVRVSLSDLPAGEGTLKVFRIDAEHSSITDNRQKELCCTEELGTVSGSCTWEGTLGARGVLYLEFNAGDQAGPVPVKGPKCARYVRAYHYYKNRNLDNFAWFDRKDWTVRLCSGSRLDTLSVAAAEILFTRTALLTVHYEYLLGLPGERVSVRVDYGTEEGFVRAVSCAETDWIPRWGTGRAPDAFFPDASFTEREGDILLALRKKAPENWNGRVILTFVLENASPGTLMKMTLR